MVFAFTPTSAVIRAAQLVIDMLKPSFSTAILAAWSRA